MNKVEKHLIFARKRLCYYRNGSRSWPFYMHGVVDYRCAIWEGGGTGPLAPYPRPATAGNWCHLKCSEQWRSQDIADARAQHGHTTFVLQTSAR